MYVLYFIFFSLGASGGNLIAGGPSLQSRAPVIRTRFLLRFLVAFGGALIVGATLSFQGPDIVIRHSPEARVRI